MASGYHCPSCGPTPTCEVTLDGRRVCPDEECVEPVTDLTLSSPGTSTTHDPDERFDSYTDFERYVRAHTRHVHVLDRQE